MLQHPFNIIFNPQQEQDSQFCNNLLSSLTQGIIGDIPQRANKRASFKYHKPVGGAQNCIVTAVTRRMRHSQQAWLTILFFDERSFYYNSRWRIGTATSSFIGYWRWCYSWSIEYKSTEEWYVFIYSATAATRMCILII